MEREARSISSLNHPHICTLHDIGSQDGVDFLVMEHLDGETLADRVQRGATPIEEALQIAIRIADALDKAHARGIVHRDLKPANIMLTKHGPKLMDFGLAKPAPGLGSASGASPLTPSTPTMSVAALSASASPLTQKGTVVGTFQYMAPEVLQGAEADARSDVFSFGCVLYEMFTGRRAFEGKSQFSVLGAILDKEPERISTVLPNSPPRLDETVWRCLAKSPEQRYGCMHDVRIQLEALAEPQAQAAGAPAELKESAGNTRVPWLVAGIAALIALIIGAAYIFQSPNPAAVVQSSILPPAGTSFITMLPASGPAVLSPDGTRIAFSARDEKSKVLLYVRPLASLTAQPLAGTEDAMYPFWSPESREIGFFTPGKLKKINSDGGPPQILCDSMSGRGGAWSKEGVIVFSPSTTQGLLRVSAAGGTPEPASKLDLAQAENSHRWPSFLPDGKHFLYWSRTSRAGEPSVLYAGELGTLQAKVLMKSESMAVYAPGHLLFLRGQTLMAQPFNPDRLELGGEPVPIAEHIAINGASVRAMFSASNTGTLIYQSGETSGGWNLVWWGRDGKLISSIPQSGRYLGPRLSPDGTKLAVEIFAGAQGIGDIWIFDLTRGTSTRLTFGPYSQGSPTWSADGKTVYYSSGPGSPYIAAKASDGSTPERIVLEDKDTREFPDSLT
jgi:serine/threonine protein kinase